ncbi:MAG: hypothetical protein KDC70_00260 [Saprospiraceae bacterium]|nr:hypothetical protein [Saprospiraceae bacterium]
MAGIQAVDTNGVETEFTCEQYALMGYTLPSGWTQTGSTCGVYFDVVKAPFASFGIALGGTTLPGRWYVYEAAISSNRVIIPTSTIVLPTIPENVHVIVRRQEYRATDAATTRDFAVNNTDNSIDFQSGLGLNGQTAYIRVFK